MVMTTRDKPHPIVLLTNDQDTTHVCNGRAAGIFGYVIAGLEPATIKPVFDVAVVRFRHQ